MGVNASHLWPSPHIESATCDRSRGMPALVRPPSGSAATVIMDLRRLQFRRPAEQRLAVFEGNQITPTSPNDVDVWEKDAEGAAGQTSCDDLVGWPHLGASRASV
jgi:hypothetical protein